MDPLRTASVWCQKFLKDAGGTGFWHGVHLMSGGIEAIYADRYPASRRSNQHEAHTSRLAAERAEVSRQQSTPLS